MTPTTQGTPVGAARRDKDALPRSLRALFSQVTFNGVQGSGLGPNVLRSQWRVEEEPLLPTADVLLPPKPAENIWGGASAGGFDLVHPGMLERSDVTVRAEDVTIRDAARGLLRRSGVTLAIAAWAARWSYHTDRDGGSRAR